MAKIIDRAITNSNQVGNVIILWTMALSNDVAVDLSTLSKAEMIQERNYIHIPGNENIPGNFSNSLVNTKASNDEDVILSFANKLYLNSKDIDPEIGRVAKKILWDLI
jgi:hypothetical protein